MREPKFWNSPGSLWGSILSPLSGFYQLGSFARRFAATPLKSSKPLICVGNIVTGGAGKTPTALAIADILKTQAKTPVFVTRGYGGKNLGPLRVDPSRHTAADVGDEALLLARIAPTWVARDRVAAVKEAEVYGSHVILDDGLQNPNLLPTTSFLIVDGGIGIGNGKLIPAGPLRESLASGLKRVDAAIIIGDDATNLETRLTVPVLHGQLEPRIPIHFLPLQKFLAFAGIGRPQKFYDTCHAASLNLVAVEDFPDHHVFSQGDLLRLQKNALRHNAKLLTTEKDWVRLPDQFRKHVEVLPVTLKLDDPHRLLASLIP